MILEGTQKEYDTHNLIVIIPTNGGCLVTLRPKIAPDRQEVPEVPQED